MLSTRLITGESNLDLGETCVCWDSPLKRNYLSFKLKKQLVRRYLTCIRSKRSYYANILFLTRFPSSNFSIHDDSLGDNYYGVPCKWQFPVFFSPSTFIHWSSMRRKNYAFSAFDFLVMNPQVIVLFRGLQLLTGSISGCCCCSNCPRFGR